MKRACTYADLVLLLQGELGLAGRLQLVAESRDALGFLGLVKLGHPEVGISKPLLFV